MNSFHAHSCKSLWKAVRFLCACALPLAPWAARSSLAASPFAGRAPGIDASGYKWSRSFGDSLSQGVYAVDFASDGSLAIAGRFNGTMDLGGGPLTALSTDAFVAKFDSGGNHIWSRRFGDADVQVGSAVAADGTGGIVLGGYFNGVIDVGGGPLVSNGVDVFVARFDSNGNHLWSHSFGDSSQQFLTGVAIDASGNVVIIGDLNGSIDFGGGPLSSTDTFDTDVFVAKFDANGMHLWSRRFGDSNPQYGYGVDTDGSGNVVITGAMAGSVDFGGGVLTGAGAQDVFVAKLDADGNHLWSQRFGDADWQLGEAVAVDAAGNVAVTGDFAGTIDFGSGLLTSAGLDDIFLAKLDADGNALWSRRFGDSTDEDPFDVAMDGSGNIAIVGNFSGVVDFGGGPLTSAGSWDIYVAKFDPNGSHLWSDRFGDSGTQYALGISAEAGGDVAIGGWFEGSVDFGGGPLTSAGRSDAFVARLGDPPVAVTLSDLVAEAGAGYVELRWTVSLDAPAQIVVLRSEGEAGEYLPVGAGLQGRPGRSDLSYRDATAGPSSELYYKIGCMESGSGSWIYSAPVRVVTRAGVFAFLGASPNPGRVGEQHLQFELGREGRARLEVYDVAGRRVRCVADAVFESGVNTVEWDGRGEDGRRVAPGAYWVKLQAEGRSTSGKILLLH